MRDIAPIAKKLFFKYGLFCLFSSFSRHNDKYRTKFDHLEAQMVCLGFEPRTAGWQAQTNPMSYVGPQKIVLNVTPKRSSIQGMSLQWLYLQLYLQRMPERLATDVICFKVCTNECECFDPLSCRDRIFHLKLALAVVERLRPDDRISTPLSLSLSLS